MQASRHVAHRSSPFPPSHHDRSIRAFARLSDASFPYVRSHSDGLVRRMDPRRRSSHPQAASGPSVPFSFHRTDSSVLARTSSDPFLCFWTCSLRGPAASPFFSRLDGITSTIVTDHVSFAPEEWSVKNPRFDFFPRSAPRTGDRTRVCWVGGPGRTTGVVQLHLRMETRRRRTRWTKGHRRSTSTIGPRRSDEARDAMAQNEASKPMAKVRVPEGGAWKSRKKDPNVAWKEMDDRCTWWECGTSGRSRENNTRQRELE
mmetsp:Transcript_7075/g.43583  ORF Transcript_7075/g.43583 Transcript_7075/m.43583 type:complete len:259 (+) Transcript_7075:101-877(+)